MRMRSKPPCNGAGPSPIYLGGSQMAKDKVKKDADIHIRISTENKSQLEEICEAEKRSQSQQIEYWITQYFARRR